MATTKPVLTKIEEGIESYILTIRRSTDYYFDWYTVNETDVASQTFPSAEIFIDSEECQDEEDGVWAGGYNQHVYLTIRVRMETANEETNPTYDINKELNKALDDLKRMFGNQYTVSDSCDTMMYKGMIRVLDRSNNILRASYMDTQWFIKYTQDRKNPTSYSN
jgi:hypothetical protein